MGGDRGHPFVVAVTEGLQARGVAAVGPDLRDPDPVVAAGTLVELAEALLADADAEHLFLIGYSWGSVVSSIATPTGLAGRVLVAPPVSLQLVPDTGGRPTLVLVPAHDQFGGPEAVNEAMGDWTDTTIEVVEGADHFLAGAVDRIADRTIEWVTARA